MSALRQTATQALITHPDIKALEEGGEKFLKRTMLRYGR